VRNIFKLKEVLKFFNGKDVSKSKFGVSLMQRYNKTLPSLNKRDVLSYYSKNPMLNTCVSKISESISITEWQLFKSSKGSRQRVYSHYLLDTIKIFNPLLSSGIDGWYIVQANLELAGNAYIHKERDDSGRTKFLWTYNPNDVYELPSPQNYYTYKIKIGETFQHIPMTEIIHIKKPNPTDIYGFGVGIAEVLANELQISELASKQVNQYFYNGAIPPYVVGADITPEQLGEMKDNWLSENQGFFNRNKPYFTNASNITIQKLMDTFKDMELVSLMGASNDTIRKSFGIPPEIIGEIQNSNRATIQGAREIYALEVLVPRLLKLRDVIQQNLIEDEAPGLMLDFATPVPSDKELTIRVMQEFPEAFPLNEIRSFIGFEPIVELVSKYATTKTTATKTEEGRFNLDGSRKDDGGEH